MNVFHSEAVVNEVIEDKLWKELSAKEFLNGYSNEDAAYDTYSEYEERSAANS